MNLLDILRAASGGPPVGGILAQLLGRALGGNSARYKLIEPINPDAFPDYNGLKVVRLDGTENWKASGGAVYTSDFADIIKSQSRASVVGFCADYTFLPSVQGIASMSDDAFIFNGTSSVAVNGNLSFKDDHTASTAAWSAYLAEHPLTILISTNSPDTSVWKPAKDSNGVTGYWNGASGFVAVYGGIPHYGDNLITDEVIAGAYTNAWISSAYVWTTANSSASFAVPVTVGSRYLLAWDNTDSDTVGAVFRYGFTDDNSPSNSNTLSTPRARTTPQEVQSVEVEASKDYLIIQVGSGAFPANTEHLSVCEMIGYEPPMLLGFKSPNPEPNPDDENPEDDGHE